MKNTNRDIYDELKKKYPELHAAIKQMEEEQMEKEQKILSQELKIKEIKAKFDGVELEKAVRELLAPKENLALLLRMF